MTESEKAKMLKTNTILWLIAIIAPIIFYFAFQSTKFPWPIIIPMILIGPLIGSNNLLSQAIGETTEDSKEESPQ